MLSTVKSPSTRLFCLIVGILMIATACQSPPQSTDTSPKVQAILKHQANVFDVAKKEQVAGDYLEARKLKVPDDLAPQNKWVMFEGPVLENELIAYRVYMDSRHRYDIYGKRVHDLVMDTVGWQYHEIMDWGSDILKVGNSLGMGSPALWYEDSLYTLSTAKLKLVKLSAASDTFVQYKFDFQGFQIGPHAFVLTQTWSLSSGSPWSEVCLDVKGRNLPADVQFATGIVDHGMKLDTVHTPAGIRPFTWGPQSFHEEDMGMALDFGENKSIRPVSDPYSHAFVIENDGGKTCYRFMAAWSRDVQGIRNAADFEAFLARD